MLQGSSSKMHTPSDEDIKSSRQAKLGVAISPLAVPLLAGLGTIATAMSFAVGGDVIHIIISLAAFAIICLVTYFCFRYSEEVVKFF